MFLKGYSLLRKEWIYGTKVEAETPRGGLCRGEITAAWTRVGWQADLREPLVYTAFSQLFSRTLSWVLL